MACHRGTSVGSQRRVILDFILHPRDVGLFSAERSLFCMIPSQSQRQKCSVFRHSHSSLWSTPGSHTGPARSLCPTLWWPPPSRVHRFPCAAVAVQKGQVWCCEGERDRIGLATLGRSCLLAGQNHPAPGPFQKKPPQWRWSIKATATVKWVCRVRTYIEKGHAYLLRLELLS